MSNAVSDEAPNGRLIEEAKIVGDEIVHKSEEVSNSDNMFIDNEMVPVNNELDGEPSLIGMICESEEEAYRMFCEYAHSKGFGVRKGKQYFWEGSDKLVKSKMFFCNKAGEKVVNLKRQPKCTRPNRRTSCGAFIKFMVSKEGKWEVVAHVKDHNHELVAPQDAHLLRSARKMNKSGGKMLLNLRSSGMKLTDAFDYMCREVGGSEHVGFSKRDAYNFVNKEKLKLVELADINALLSEFEKKSSEDSMFRYELDVSKEGRLRNFFWCDGRSVADYGHFGDVVTFDTSYRTNKYNLVCALFVGVNHHCGNVIFGCAFISTETTNSFVWLFQKFLDAMGGKQPITLFTNGDRAMAHAIHRVFPNTRHRVCVWHIFQNVASFCPNLVQYNQLKDLFWKCVHGCDSIVEFDATWNLLIQYGNFEQNQLLQSLYELREKWSAAYNKDVVDLNIQSSQRSESANNLFHDFMAGMETLVECFHNMEILLKSWRKCELEEDFKNFQCAPAILPLPVLFQVSQFYTLKVYDIFQDEWFKGMGGLAIEERMIDSGVFEFMMRPLQGPNPRSVSVTLDVNTETVACTCKKWESMYMLCAHALRAFTYRNINPIPNKYLAKRWSKRAKEGFLRNISRGIEGDSESMYRNQVTIYAYKLIDHSRSSKEARAIVLEGLSDIEKGLEEQFLAQNLQRPSDVASHSGDPSSIFSPNVASQLLQSAPSISSRSF